MAQKYYHGNPTGICGKDVQEGVVLCYEAGSASYLGAIVCHTGKGMADTLNLVGTMRSTGIKPTSVSDLAQLGALVQSEGCFTLEGGTVVVDYNPMSWNDPRISVPTDVQFDEVTPIQVLTGSHAGQILYQAAEKVGENAGVRAFIWNDTP